MASWKDEKEIVLVSLVASLLFMTVLDLALGAIYTGMLSVYYLFLKEPWTIQFSRDRKYLSPGIFITAIIALMAYYMIANILNLPTSTHSIIGFSIKDVTLANPVLKSLIWIFFIPLAETLFFFGIVFGYLKYKFRIHRVDARALGVFAVFGVLIGLFHILSQKMDMQTLYIDILFTSVSGLVVLKYNELKHAFWIHVFANILGVYALGGLAWLLG